MTRRIVAGSVVAALAGLGVLAFAGPAGAVSEQKYRKQVNALCDELTEARVPLLPASGTSVYSRKDAAVAQAYATAAVPLYRELMDGIAGLKPPKASKDKAQAFEAGLDKGTAAIQQDPMSAFSPLDNPFQAAYDASKRLKTKSCDNIAAQRL